jgi:preprotein translocase SecE subunit
MISRGSIKVQKDDSTWLNIGLTLFGICMAFVMWKAMDSLSLQMGWTEKFEAWLPVTTLAVSVVVGGAAAWWLNTDAERHEYFLSCIAELRKVSWPSMDDTRKMTIIVCIVVAVFSAILTVFDVAWAWLLKQLIA